MSQFNESHPFQVYIWVNGNAKAGSLFERGHWMEIARCLTARRAEEVGMSLSLRHQVQVAQLVTDADGARFVGYKFYPSEARRLISGKN